MSNRTRVRLLVALVVAAVAWYGRQQSQAGTVRVEASAPASSADRPAGGTHGEIGFRDAGLLHEHYLKHGREFGNFTEARYLEAAQQLRDADAGDDILEDVRADGVVTRFDRSTGGFIAYDRDLTIRTFFKPNDGERYYRRQLARGHSDP